MHTKREPDLYPAPGILPAAGKSVLPLRHYSAFAASSEPRT